MPLALKGANFTMGADSADFDFMRNETGAAVFDPVPVRGMLKT